MQALGSIQSVNRRSLHEEVVEKLRAFVVEWDLKPGQKIPEKSLCERLGISRTPLREALKVLAADGLITLIPNRGAIVREISRADIEELFPVMGALEALAGELACEHITDQELATIQETHERMLEYFEADRLVEYSQCNRRIHELILAAARNDTLTSHYESLSSRLRRARYMANVSGGRWPESVAEHSSMIIALQRREGPALGQIMKSHLEKIFSAVLDWMDNQER